MDVRKEKLLGGNISAFLWFSPTWNDKFQDVWAAAQLVDCLPVMKEALDSISVHNNIGMMAHTYNPSIGRWMLDNQKHKFILSSMMSLKVALNTWDY